MILHDVQQGTPEWHSLRMRPTASNFRRVFTSQKKRSTSFDEYAIELTEEIKAGRKLETFKSEWMQRGNDMEAQANAMFQLETGLVTTPIGFVTTDDGLVGCSPDAIVHDDDKGETALLEIKCPKPTTHIKYLLANKVPADYIPQVQGQLWITEKPYAYFMSFHPDHESLIIRVERDEEYISGLATELNKLLDKVNANLKKLGVVHGI
jgi:hypothetical protein